MPKLLFEFLEVIINQCETHSNIFHVCFLYASMIYVGTQPEITFLSIVYSKFYLTFPMFISIPREGRGVLADFLNCKFYLAFPMFILYLGRGGECWLNFEIAR